MSLIKQLENYAKKFPEKEKKYVSELTKEGEQVAVMGLERAETSDVNDDTFITAETHGKMGYVTMAGYKAGFIEFGTGTFYASASEVHPLADKFGAIRGEWGEGKGEHPPWIFMGEAGSTGRDTGKGFVETYGQPANRVIYNTGKHIEQIYVDVAKEVFKND